MRQTKGFQNREIGENFSGAFTCKKRGEIPTFLYLERMLAYVIPG